VEVMYDTELDSYGIRCDEAYYIVFGQRVSRQRER